MTVASRRRREEFSYRENWTPEGKKIIEEMDQPSPSCFKCSHFKTCRVPATLMPAVDSMFQGDDSPPLRGKDLEIIAQRCNEYDVKVENDILTP